MKTKNVFFILGILLVCCFMLTGNSYGQKLKFGYVNSQKILNEYKEAQDANKKFQEINAAWEAEGLEMQNRLQELMDELESQSLLLSEQRKMEKQAEAQNLYTQFQTFQAQKWGPDGEAAKKEQELMAPIIETIRGVIKQIGEADEYTYIFDSVAGNIVYVADDQTDLTDRVIEELNKDVKPTGTN